MECGQAFLDRRGDYARVIVTLNQIQILGLSAGLSAGGLLNCRGGNSRVIVTLNQIQFLDLSAGLSAQYRGASKLPWRLRLGDCYSGPDFLIHSLREYN